MGSLSCTFEITSCTCNDVYIRVYMCLTPKVSLYMSLPGFSKDKYHTRFMLEPYLAAISANMHACPFLPTSKIQGMYMWNLMLVLIRMFADGRSCLLFVAPCCVQASRSKWLSSCCRRWRTGNTPSPLWSWCRLSSCTRVTRPPPPPPLQPPPHTLSPSQPLTQHRASFSHPGCCWLSWHLGRGDWVSLYSQTNQKNKSLYSHLFELAIHLYLLNKLKL